MHVFRLAPIGKDDGSNLNHMGWSGAPDGMALHLLSKMRYGVATKCLVDARMSVARIETTCLNSRPVSDFFLFEK